MFVQHGYNSESRQMKRGLRETSIIFSQLGKYFFPVREFIGVGFLFLHHFISERYPIRGRRLSFLFLVRKLVSYLQLFPGLHGICHHFCYLCFVETFKTGQL
jgi:hypothetical protein